MPAIASAKMPVSTRCLHRWQANAHRDQHRTLHSLDSPKKLDTNQTLGGSPFCGSRRACDSFSEDAREYTVPASLASQLPQGSAQNTAFSGLPQEVGHKSNPWGQSISVGAGLPAIASAQMPVSTRCLHRWCTNDAGLPPKALEAVNLSPSSSPVYGSRNTRKVRKPLLEKGQQMIKLTTLRKQRRGT